MGRKAEGRGSDNQCRQPRKRKTGRGGMGGRNLKIQITENKQTEEYPYHPEAIIYTLVYMLTEQLKCQ